MELKQLNRIILLLILTVNIEVFSQMKMAEIENIKFSVNLNSEKNNIIKILDNNNYSVYYILDKKSFSFNKRLTNIDLVNLIFFSKKYNKGILTLFKQSIKYKRKSIYNITLHTESAGDYMFIPSMIILDKDFNYEYLMKYSYIHLPNDSNINTSSITIQNIKNYCNAKQIEIKGNAVNENIDDFLSYISEINKDESTKKDCNPIIEAMDLNDFFPENINKNGHVYFKK